MYVVWYEYPTKRPKSVQLEKHGYVSLESWTESEETLEMLDSSFENVNSK